MKIESLGRGIQRYGCTLTRFLSQLDAETSSLPRFLARIRTEKNEEEIRFFKDIEAKAGFMLSQQISEEQENETINREIDVNDSRVSQKEFQYMKYMNRMK